MKTLKILFVLCIMLGISVTANSQGKGKQVVRPMKGTFYEQTIDVSNPAQVKSIFTANVTHMGRVTGTSIANMAGRTVIPPNIWTDITNSKIKIAANGDEVYSYSPCVTLTFNIPLDGTGTLNAVAYTTGGTGRFEGCTGEVEVRGTFNLNTGVKEYTVEGWIKY
jgi:hypothetical protein